MFRIPFFLTALLVVLAMPTWPASAETASQPDGRMFLRLPTPTTRSTWEELGQSAKLSDAQMMQWMLKYEWIGPEIQALTQSLSDFVDDRLSTIAEESEGDGRVTLSTVHLYEEALEERLKYAEAVGILMLNASQSMDDMVTPNQRALLKGVVLEARRRIYFSFLVHPHPWASRDCLFWLRTEMDNLDVLAREQYAKVRESDEYLAATASLTNAIMNWARNHVRYASSSLRVEAAVKDALQRLPPEERELSRRDALLDRYESGRSRREANWRFAMAIDQSLRSITALFDEETRVEIERRWDRILLPEWLQAPIPDAALRYSELLGAIAGSIPPEDLEMLESLRREAVAVRVDATREMTRRYLRDFEKRTKEAAMTFESARAARATHTRQRHRMTTAAISFMDSVAAIATECLENKRLEPGLAEDVRSTLGALEEEKAGMAWFVREINRSDARAISSGAFTWPRSPGSPTNRG